MFIFPKSLYNIVHFVFKLDQPFRNTHFVNFYLLQSEKIQLVPFFGFNIRRNQKIQNLWSISRYKLLAMIDNLSRCHSFRKTTIVFLEQFLRPIDQAFFWENNENKCFWQSNVYTKYCIFIFNRICWNSKRSILAVEYLCRICWVDLLQKLYKIIKRKCSWFSPLLGRNGSFELYK